jgi:hypothetical protein
MPVWPTGGVKTPEQECQAYTNNSGILAKPLHINTLEQEYQNARLALLLSGQHARKPQNNSFHPKIPITHLAFTITLELFRRLDVECPNRELLSKLSRILTLF